MDPIELTLRGDKSPAFPDPAGAITAEEHDENLTALQTACEQLDEEKLSADAAEDITDTLTELEGSDQVIVFRAGVPYLATLAAVQAFVGGEPSATAPAAFEAGDWTATAGDEQIEINITALPDDGGSAITALQYRLDGGTWTNLTGTGTGARTITGLTNDTEYDVEVRAVNAIGSGATSDTKSRTPVAPSVTFIRFSSLSGMGETGNGTTGWIYTGSGANGNAGGADYSLASGVAGGMLTDVTAGGSSIPVAGFYTASTGAWDAGVFLIAYPLSGNWECNNSAFANLVTTARTYVAGDRLRITFNATNGYNVDIARAAAPDTWLSLATGTLTRGATLYPRVHSFDAAGAVFTAPQVA